MGLCTLIEQHCCGAYYRGRSRDALDTYLPSELACWGANAGAFVVGGPCIGDGFGVEILAAIKRWFIKIVLWMQWTMHTSASSDTYTRYVRPATFQPYGEEATKAAVH